jgi:hypothetical protein
MIEPTEKELCPNCRHILDTVIAVDENPEKNPKPGDLSVCLYCATIHKFDEQLHRRPLQLGELEKADAAERALVLRVQVVIMQKIQAKSVVRRSTAS